MTGDLVWLKKVKQIIEKYPDFEISFDSVDIFGDSVVIVRVHPSKKLTALHKSLFYTIKPNEQDFTKKYFENEKYEAHVTLGMTSWGMTKEELVIMKEKGMEELSPIPKFKATSIRIYQQMDQEEAYKKWR